MKKNLLKLMFPMLCSLQLENASASATLPRPGANVSLTDYVKFESTDVTTDVIKPTDLLKIRKR